MGLPLVDVPVRAGEPGLLRPRVGGGARGPEDLVRPAPLVRFPVAPELREVHPQQDRRRARGGRRLAGRGRHHRPAAVGDGSLLELLVGTRPRHVRALGGLQVDDPHVRLRRDLRRQQGQVPRQILLRVPLLDRQRGQRLREQTRTSLPLLGVDPAEVAHLLLRQHPPQRLDQDGLQIRRLQTRRQTSRAVQRHPVQQPRSLRGLHPPLGRLGLTPQPLPQPRQTFFRSKHIRSHRQPFGDGTARTAASLPRRSLCAQVVLRTATLVVRRAMGGCAGTGLRGVAAGVCAWTVWVIGEVRRCVPGTRRRRRP